VLGRNLSKRELDEWAGRIALHSDDHTIQAYVPLSQMPTWRADDSKDNAGGRNPQGNLKLRSVILRVFAVSDGPQSWRVLPGGLARVASSGAEIASMQRGGSSADVWVMTHGNVDKTTLLQPTLTPGAVSQRKRMVTSRAGENLFWLGRYTERTENQVQPGPPHAGMPARRRPVVATPAHLAVTHGQCQHAGVARRATGHAGAPGV
jgi:hypothetical protein